MLGAMMVREAGGGRLPTPQIFTDRTPGYVDADRLRDVFVELQRQSEKFGQQDLTLLDWGSILGEKYGEVCKATNDLHFGVTSSPGIREQLLGGVYAECIQVAAVALHMAQVIHTQAAEREKQEALHG